MKRTALLLLLLLLTGLLLVGLAAPALAENGRGADGRGQDHDRARDAVSRKDAQPLAAILPMVEARYSAHMVDVDFTSDDGHLVYEIELITPQGQIIEVVADAATGDIVKDDMDNDDGLHPED